MVRCIYIENKRTISVRENKKMNEAKEREDDWIILQ